MAASIYRVSDDFSQSGFDIVIGMFAVAVSGFDHDVISIFDWRRIVNDRFVVSAKIACHHHAANRSVVAFDIEQHKAGTQNMPGGDKLERQLFRQLNSFVIIDGLHQSASGVGIFFAIQRQCRMMFGCSGLVDEIGVFFLQTRRIGQHYPRQFDCARSSINRSVKSVAHKPWQITAMVNVCVSQNHRIYRSRIYRKRLPVSQS